MAERNEDGTYSGMDGRRFITEGEANQYDGNLISGGKSGMGIDQHFDAGKIMGGGGGGRSDAEKQADGEALYKLIIAIQKPIVEALVKNYNKGNWFAAANSIALPSFCEEVYGVRSIAYGKLGNYKKALLNLLLLEYNLHGFKDEKLKAIIEKNIGNKKKLIELSLEAAKEAVSKHLGHTATEDEFNQFYIAACETLIRKYTLLSATEKWEILVKRPMTDKDKKRIAGPNRFVKVHFFGLRNKFVSFLFGLIFGSGTAVGIDWLMTQKAVTFDNFIIPLIASLIALIAIVYNCINYNFGSSIQSNLLTFATLVVFLAMNWGLKGVGELNMGFFLLLTLPIISIFIAYHCWYKRVYSVFTVFLVLGILGYLVLFGVLPHADLSYSNLINVIKGITT